MPQKIKPKPIAVFDIDGTVFRSNMLEEMVCELVRARIFTQPHKASDSVW